MEVFAKYMAGLSLCVAILPLILYRIPLYDVAKHLKQRHEYFTDHSSWSTPYSVEGTELGCGSSSEILYGFKSSHLVFLYYLITN